MLFIILGGAFLIRTVTYRRHSKLSRSTVNPIIIESLLCSNFSYIGKTFTYSGRIPHTFSGRTRILNDVPLIS